MSKTTHDTPAAAETQSFSASMEELTEIVRRIEDEQTDIDELASALARASELLERCRSKIRQVDLEVSQIVQRLDASPGEADDPDGAAAADD
jgi:exodeoxyribonuclease VII small subunit